MNPSDDRKFKELTDRLVAMSPEPPPFPEETIVTMPGKTSRRSPLLVFAGAAALVLIAIGIPFLLLDNEPPVAAPATSTTTATSTPNTDPGSGSTTSTTEPSRPIAQFETTVYLTQSPENSFTGDPALVAFNTFVYGPAGTEDTEIMMAALNLLGNPDLVLPPGFTNSVPAGVEVLGVRRANGTDNALIIDMNEAFLDGAGGLLADFTMLNQLIYTATQDPDVDEVQFIVDNEQVTQFGSEGLNLSSSVNRETFRDELSIINVTEPVIYVSDGPIRVAGISQTFEAEMNIRVLDATGGIVYQEYMTTTDGAPSWGEYEFILDGSTLAPDYIIQVLNYSAENGEPVYVVSVPLQEGPWDFSGS